jgi:coenzyme F420-dependent glucose-6-phosphate dehydrogenase
VGRVELGYALSSEEHTPSDLVRNAKRAEEAGFSYALISDHFHPWTDSQGQSPFVWSVIGAIAQATEHLVIGTGVPCPTIRTHPAIIAQAAATSASLMPGRFFLGVGSGENLNEHILGDYWPSPDERQEMLEEAIEVICLLWKGNYQTHRGKHYRVENARLYTLPDDRPPIAVAAPAPKLQSLRREPETPSSRPHRIRKSSRPTARPAEMARAMASSRSAGQRTRSGPSRRRSNNGRTQA